MKKTSPRKISDDFEKYCPVATATGRYATAGLQPTHRISYHQALSIANEVGARARQSESAPSAKNSWQSSLPSTSMSACDTEQLKLGLGIHICMSGNGVLSVESILHGSPCEDILSVRPDHVIFHLLTHQVCDV